MKNGFHLDNKLGAEFAVAADICGGTGDEMLLAKPTDSSQKMREINSPVTTATARKSFTVTVTSHGNRIPSSA